MARFPFGSAGIPFDLFGERTIYLTKRKFNGILIARCDVCGVERHGFCLAIPRAESFPLLAGNKEAAGAAVAIWKVAQAALP